MLDFLGEAATAFARFLKGRANFRMSDLLLFLQESGTQALPIVSLISLLVGLILAFVGAVQLATFGAQIYVADLVGVAMVRVMGAIMTGIIMAGRTGASYAAQLGTMQVNEEIDALKTLGVSPMEFLVLPRMLALVIMMPLLGVYADVMGILGGLVVGVFMLDLNPIVYLNETKGALNLTNVWIGHERGLRSDRGPCRMPEGNTVRKKCFRRRPGNHFSGCHQYHQHHHCNSHHHGSVQRAWNMRTD
jgi:phospholipid/cholesterol/gamma-HCH transport system permease protein